MQRNLRALSMVERTLEEARLTEPLLPPIARVELECFAQLQNVPAHTEVAPGTVLVEQGTHPQSVSILSCGLVRLVSIDAEGRQTTLGLRSSGWYAGAVQAIMRAPSPYSVVAVTNCTLSAIAASDFSLKLTQNSTMMQHFVAALCNEVSAQTSACPQDFGNTTLSFPACPEMKVRQPRSVARVEAAQSESQLAWQDFARGA